MHVHPGRVILCAMLSCFFSAGCRSKVVAEKRADATPSTTIEPESSVDARTNQLCASRPRCGVDRRTPVAGTGSAELWVLRLAHAPDAGSDEDRCDQREYWLLQSQKTLLLARDCERQWGADNPGPAETRIEGTRFFVKYAEFQSSDGCEVCEATVQLSPLSIEKYVRWKGTPKGDHCEQQKRKDRLAPAGDGSMGHPLLVLHQG